MSDTAAFGCTGQRSTRVLLGAAEATARIGARTVLYQLTDRGFCSELNVMLLALLHSRTTGRRFILSSRYWNAAAPRGWRDYFEPFTVEWDPPILPRHSAWPAVTLRSRVREAVQRLVAFPRYGRVFFTHDIRSRVWNAEYIAARDPYAGCRALLASIWRFRPEVRAAVDALRSRLGLHGGRHVTIHVRRGDKAREATFLPVERYAVRARQTAPGARTCFVMTDDYAVVPEVARLCPEWEVVTAAAPCEAGHVQGRFNGLPAGARREATTRMIAELVLASEGVSFVGTFSSNVARFVALLRGRETTHGVDFPYRLYY